MLSNNTTFEQQVLELTNQERAKNGLSPLKANDELNYTADKYAEDMSQRGVLSHTGADGSQAWDRAKTVGYEARMMGENIALGQTTPQQVVQDWMNSSGHRANILNSGYTELGVGFHNNYWVQNFGSGDTNSMTNIPNSTSNSGTASNSTSAPQSTPTGTITLNSVYSSDSVSEPTSQSISDDIGKETGDDWLLNGGMGNDTLSSTPNDDTFLVSQDESFAWLNNNLQFSEDKAVIDCSIILGTLVAQQTDNYTMIGDSNTGTWLAQLKEVNPNALMTETQNTFV
ncbi:CAP domain-containing protein [Brasilonema sp. UFV-L1]|uniref:CAP domain-containing protein n=1 Tax=Brasilonema sp. UFV-L1 TaxID=2234130 RepID=UPI00145D09C1|nr:CAP domain-containing protein [Brasilonema sp. UFV-L1]NMG06550.1 hypothetical protein [Brasilonema sp. UFV-L1]